MARTMNTQTSQTVTKLKRRQPLAAAAVLTLGIAAITPAQAEFGEGFVHYVDRNYVAAQEAIVPDAEKGDPAAQWLRGTMHLFGKGMVQDEQTARAWFEKAAAKNYRPAQVVLSQMNKKGVSAERAARRAIADAAYLMGRKFQDGNGVHRDGLSALKLLSLAADHGNTDAQYRAAKVLLTDPAVPESPAHVARWLTRAADAGHAHAQLLLGTTMLNGLIGTYDPDAGYALIRKAADGGLADAQVKLGDFYASGLLYRADHAEALAWWRKAAAKHNSGAQLRIARAYARGRAVTQDFAQAYAWAALSARQGNEQAGMLLEIVTRKLQPAELQVAKRKLNEMLAGGTPVRLASTS